MVAAVSTTAVKSKTTSTPARNQNPKRPPLLPSDPDNALAPTSRPKSREVTSRYMSTSSTSTSASSTSKRFASPVISRTTTAATMMTPKSSPASTVIKRSQSVERRREGTPRPTALDFRLGNSDNGGEVSNAQKMLIKSTRSLSVSFQGESFSFQVSKAKPAPSMTSSVRKGTPERRKAATPTPSRGGDQAENSRPVEHLQHRWPGRLRQQQSSMSRSVDFKDEMIRNNADVVRALHHPLMDHRSSIESRLSSDCCDTDSVSSSSTSESSGAGCGAGGGGQRGGRGIIVPARVWQETNYRLRRQTSEPCSPGSKIVGLKGPVPPKLTAPKKFGNDSPVSSPKGVVNSRGQLSPIRGGGGVLRPASPSKLGLSPSIVSPMRGLSPSRIRNVSGHAPICNANTPSILSFAADIRRGKIGEDRIVDLHFLRLFHNRLMQWRFINARADSSLLAQRLNAEKSLYNACVATTILRESVRAKKTELQMLKQNLKLCSILKGQMVFLNELELMEQDYSSSLEEASEALRASTLRLPVVGGARADVQSVKEALSSAVDVMQAMASSICLLSSKVGEVYSLITQLASVTSKERALLNQCKDNLSSISTMQVMESSLRTHTLQLKRPFVFQVVYRNYCPVGDGIQPENTYFTTETCTLQSDN